MMTVSGHLANVELIDNGKSNRINDIYFILFSIVVFLYLLLGGGFTVQESFIIVFQLYLLLRFVNNFGYTICFFDYLVFYSALATLVLPLIGYRVYNIDNPMARKWVAYMPVPEDVYYNFLIPANLALFTGVNLLTRKFTPLKIKDLFNELAVKAQDKGKMGIVLTIIGFFATFLNNVGGPLSFVFYLMSMLKYVGPLYIFFSNLPFRRQALIISLIMFLIQSIWNGMFGEFVQYLLLALILITINVNLRFITKLLIFIVGFFLLSILQSIKGAYRSVTWMGKTVNGLSLQNSSPVEVFGTLFIDRLTNTDKLFDAKTSFELFVRMNQGYLIARAMDYVPRVEPFANGETIIRTIGAIIVPRFLWPDKMESGGSENLARFLGIKRKLNYSMNIGPYGEAYGNFGSDNGVLFLFVFSLFLSFLFKKFLTKCLKRPTLILWGPLLFYYMLSIETDILSTLNSFVKGAIFVAIVFWISNKFFKASL
jgi:hypothetical protein